MKRYGVIIFTIFQGFQIHSTEPQIVEWAMAEIRKSYPKYKFRDVDKHGFFAHDTTPYTELNFEMLAQLLKDGWEPFAVDHSSYHLRKEFE